MASFEVRWKNSAAKDLRSLDQQMKSRVLQMVGELANQPFPQGVRKLVGSEHTYRIQVGDYRIIYSVEQAVLIIEILRVRHRREVYR